MVRRVCPCPADELLFFPFWNCSLFVCQVQHALKKSEKALDTLNKAINIDPKNPLCKFHRASVLFANEKYKVSLGAGGSLDIPGAGDGDALGMECFGWMPWGAEYLQVSLGSSRACRRSWDMASVCFGKCHPHQGAVLNALIVRKSGADRCCF